MIVGKGNGWQNAPSHGDCEFWGINDVVTYRDVTMNFDMHKLDERYDPGIVEKYMKADLSDPKIKEIYDIKYQLFQTVKRVQELDIKLYTLKHYDFCTNSIAYPREEITEKYRTDYFTNGIDYMLAYAIHTNATHIDIYGVNMAITSEYAYEKPGVDFWIGFAKGRGIKVNIHTNVSTIMKAGKGKIYGYEIPQTFKEASNMETAKFKFSVIERLLLLECFLTAKGSYEKVKSIENVRNRLIFTEKEREILQFRNNQQNLELTEWNDGVADIEIETNDYGISHLIESLEYASDQGNVTKDMLPIYERFVVNKKGAAQ